MVLTMSRWSLRLPLEWIAAVSSPEMSILIIDLHFFWFAISQLLPIPLINIQIQMYINVISIFVETCKKGRRKIIPKLDLLARDIVGLKLIFRI